MRRRNDSRGAIVIAAFIVAIFVAFIAIGVSSTAHTETVSNCTVNDKDRTRGTDGKSDMRVYTDNCGTFAVTDSLIEGDFAAADRFSKIKVGQTYTFETRGKRIPLLSQFPNIVRIS